MLETILFYGCILVFVLVIIAWSLSELARLWQLGVVMSAVHVLGVVLLLAWMVVRVVQDGVLAVDTLAAIFAFVLALVAGYLHFRLMGTMMAPLAALGVVLVLVAAYLDKLPEMYRMLPMVAGTSAPWISAALALSAVGLALASACACLGAIYLVRRKTTVLAPEVEAARADEMAAALTTDGGVSPETLDQQSQLKAMLQNTTARMPRVLSHLSWWALLCLSFALGSYALWCHTLFGVYWLWQPFFALAAAAWLVLFVAKDVCMVRVK